MLLPKYSRRAFVVLSIIALTILVGSGRVAGLSGSNGFPAFKFLKASENAEEKLAVRRGTTLIPNNNGNNGNNNNDKGLPSLSVADVFVSEGQIAKLTFIFDRTLAEDITVNYKIAGGPAKKDEDFTEIGPTELTFTANGPTSITKDIANIIDDSIDEDTEFFVVTINNSKDFDLGGADPGSAKVFIIDNDENVGEVELGADSLNVTEGGTASATVTRSSSSGSTSVVLSTTNGSASADDYKSVSTTVTFGPGETSKTVSIETTDDKFDENDETVSIALSNPQNGATLGSRANATLTIEDNDDGGKVQFEVTSVEISEDGQTAAVKVKRTDGEADGVMIDYATIGGGTAIDGTDYTSVNGTFSFGAGETTKTFTVPIIDNTLVGSDKTINLQLSNPKGGASIGDPGSSLIKIKDNDLGGRIQFSATSYSVNEDIGTMAVMATRLDGAASGVSIDYSTISGTAKAGSDYTTSTGTLSFSAGESSKMFNIQIADDSLVEDSETATLALANPKGGAVLGSVASAILTIIDNEVPGAVQFSASAYTANKGDSEAIITVVRNKGFDGDAKVNFVAGNGTAVAGIDFAAVSGVLNFNANGAKTNTFSVPLLNNGGSSGDKTINLFLTGPSGGVALGNPQAAVLTVIDANALNPAQLQFNAGQFRVNEADGSATISVTRTGNMNVPVSVAFAASGGTAAIASDYALSSGTLTFSPGVSTQSFTVGIIDDANEESEETVNLVLLNPAGNAVLGQIVATTLSIIDNDAAAPLPKGLEVDKTIDFGNVIVGKSVTRSINIRNTGGAEVSFSVPSLISGTDQGFSIVSQPAALTLGPGQTTSFNVALKPSDQADSLLGASVIRSNGVEFITLLIGSATDRTIFDVFRPRDREVLTSGLPYFVRFAYVNRELPATFTISYSIDGGTTFPFQNQIGIVGPNSRGLIWNLPDDLVTETGRIQVIARFPSGVVATALSGIFSVRKPGAPPNALTIGDFNKDGILDLAIAKAGAKGLAVLVGKGDGGFAAPVETLLGVDARALVNADFNKDGLLDIATANQDSGSVSILFGRGDASFNAPKNITLNSAGASIAVGDLNGDGNLDIAVGNVKPNSLSLLFGDGKGNFGNLKSFPLPAGSKGVAIADLNGDGKLDVTTANFGSDDVSILFGDGRGNFDGVINPNAARNIKVGVSPTSIAVGDFNEDGVPDLATANFNSDDVSVLVGNGNGRFGASVEFPTGFGPSSMTVRDFDKDGHLDIVTSNLNTNDVGVLFGDGRGTFSAPIFYSAAQGPAAIGSGDFNLDNNLDLVTSNQISDNLTVLVGDGKGGFADAAIVGTGGSGPTPEPMLRVLLTFDPPSPGVIAPPSNLKANAFEAGRPQNAAQPMPGSIEPAADPDLAGFNIYRVPAPALDEQMPTPDEIVGDPKNLIGSAPASATSFTDTVSTSRGNNFVYSATSFFSNGQQSGGSSTAATDLPVIKNPAFRKNSLFIDSAGSFIASSGAMLIINDADAFPLAPDETGSQFTVPKKAEGSVSGATLRRLLRKGTAVRLVVKNPDGKLSVGVQFTRAE